MTLEDCEAAIAAIESGRLKATAEAIEVRAIAIARRCRAATWNTSSFRDKAEGLAPGGRNCAAIGAGIGRQIRDFPSGRGGELSRFCA